MREYLFIEENKSCLSLQNILVLIGYHFVKLILKQYSFEEIRKTLWYAIILMF